MALLTLLLSCFNLKKIQETIHFNQTFACTLLFIIIISIFLMLSKINGSSSEKLNLPPSPPKLPIIGNLHQLGLLLHKSLHDLSQKYGPLMLLRLGYCPTLIVSSAEIIRDIQTNHDIPFANRPQTTAGKLMLYGSSDLAFSPYGEYWRQIRKISVVELFSSKKVQSFKWVREDEINLLISKISRSCSVANPVNIKEIAINLANDVTCRCAFGRKHGGHNGKDNFGELANEFLRLLTVFTFGDLYPWLGWLDILTGLISKMKKISKELDTFLEQIIDEHLIQNKHDDPDYIKDYVDILLQFQKENNSVTRDNIKALLLDNFVAGTETTSATIEWTFAEIIKNPHVLQKVQDEVRRVVGKKNKVKEEDINKMDYLKSVVKESLRLHPPAGIIPRETSTVTSIQGYDIPAKTRVLVNIWSIHRDPKLWERPDMFIPERFSNSPLDFKGQDFMYIPFGSGRRSCPGMAFGVAVVEIAIANLLYWFNWRMPADKELDMEEAFGLALKKKTPLHLLPVSCFSGIIE